MIILTSIPTNTLGEINTLDAMNNNTQALKEIMITINSCKNKK
jgi:hypothetical protein